MQEKTIHLIDTTLRDGSHAVSHQYTLQQTSAIAKALCEANVEYIEVTHGDGLNGSSQNYGFSAFTDAEKLKAANAVLDKKTVLTVLALPGIATVNDIQQAYTLGAQMVRVATHVTEADVAQEHIQYAKKIGMTAVGFLMMGHMASKEKIVEQAKLFCSYGADLVYLADSAGAMTPAEVTEKIGALVQSCEVPVGFHAHNNLGLAVANALAAANAGATFLDGSLRGLGAGAGNAPTEVLAAVLAKMGYAISADLYKVSDAAEDVVAPLMQRPQIIDKTALMLGYAGVYSSFLLHTKRAAQKYNLDPRDVLVELGRRKMVGGQEDMIINVAYDLAKQKNKQLER